MAGASPDPGGFIPPGEDLTDLASERRREVVGLSKQQLAQRWQTDRGKQILAELISTHFDRSKLVELVGRYDGHFDLRGAPLASQDLSRTDLSSIDFYSADLSQADLTGSRLCDSWLSEARVKGTRFDWAVLNGALLDNVEFDRDTSFVGVDLNGPSFVLAALLRWQAEDQQRIEHLKRRHPAFALVLRATTDYGRSLGRWALWCVLVIAVFGWLFGTFDSLASASGLAEGVYLSVVTFTTLGYGDVVPEGAGRGLAVVEVLLGYSMLGLLVAILSRKVTGR